MSLLLTFCIAGIASAGNPLFGQTSAKFAWEPAPGPVDAYGVYVSRNGEAWPDTPEEVVDVPSIEVFGEYGDSIKIKVVALDNDFNAGPISFPSQKVSFIEISADDPPPVADDPPPPADDPPPVADNPPPPADDPPPVADNPPPPADDRQVTTTLSMATTTPKLGESVTATAIVEGASDSGVVEFLFDCESDGNWDRVVNTSTRMATHDCQYDKPGTYEVSILAWDRTECCGEDRDRSSAIVVEAPPQAIEARISSVSANPISTADSVKVTAQVTNASADGIVEYLFDCDNDGSWDGVINSVEREATHDCTYSEAGTYTIKLLAWDRTECCGEATDHYTDIVVAAAAPPPDIEIIAGNSAILSWEPADGTVDSYAVYVSRNGGPIPNEPNDIVEGNEAIVQGQPGEILVVQVAALDDDFAAGPLSQPSFPIQFQAAAPDPVPAPEPAPEPDPVSEPGPDPEPEPQPQPTPEPEPQPEPEPAPSPVVEDWTRELHFGYGAPQYYYQYADVNADDRQDLILRDHIGRVWVAAGGAMGFENPTLWHASIQVPPEEIRYADVNGDGRDDLLAFTATGSQVSGTGDLRVSLSNGEGFTPAGSWMTFGPSTVDQIDYADVNGDGMMDALYFDMSGEISVRLSTGTSLQNSAVWATSTPASGPGDVHYRDVTGNGMADLVITQGGGKIHVAPSTGVNFAPTELWVVHPGATSEEIQLVDLSGDGRTDIAYFDTANWNRIFGDHSVGIDFAEGAMISEEIGSSDARRMKYADVDGNGMLDAIYVATDESLTVALTGLSGFLSPVQWMVSMLAGDSRVAHYEDINGDGRDDLILESQETNEIWTALSTGSGFLTPSKWLQ